MAEQRTRLDAARQWWRPSGSWTVLGLLAANAINIMVGWWIRPDADFTPLLALSTGLLATFGGLWGVRQWGQNTRAQQQQENPR